MMQSDLIDMIFSHWAIDLPSLPFKA